METNAGGRRGEREKSVCQQKKDVQDEIHHDDLTYHKKVKIKTRIIVSHKKLARMLLLLS